MDEVGYNGSVPRLQNRHKRVAAAVLAMLFCTAPASAQSLLGRASVVARRLERLESSPSEAEREELAAAVSRWGGPPELLGPVLARLLATETAPAVRASLLSAATRLAVRAPADPALAGVASVLLARLPHAGTERAATLRALAALGTPEAIAALARGAHDAEVRAVLRWVPDRPALVEILVVELARARPADRAPIVDALAELPGTEPVLLPLLGASDALDAHVAAALATVGGVDARDALTARLTATEDAHALVAIASALAQLPAGDPAPLAARRADPDPAIARAALLAWAHTAPDAAQEALLAALSGTPEDRLAVEQALAQTTDPRWLPVADVLLEDGPRVRNLALDYLSRADDGAGLSRLAAQGEPVALALGLRRRPDDPQADGLRATLPPTPVLLALAGQTATGDGLEGAMARAIALAPAGDLEAWLMREADDATFAWLAEAARAHALPIDARWLGGALDEHAGDRRLAPLLLLVPSARGDARADRTLRRRVSRALSSEVPAVRAAAIFAAAHRGMVEALAAIEALLEDGDPSVRIAAGHGLVALDPSMAQVVLARAIVEEEPRARRVLEAVGRGEPLPAADVLLVQTVEHRPAPSTPIWLEVRTDDGLVRVLPSPRDGMFVLPGVVGTTAEVTLRLD